VAWLAGLHEGDVCRRCSKRDWTSEEAYLRERENGVAISNAVESRKRLEGSEKGWLRFVGSKLNLPLG